MNKKLLLLASLAVSQGALSQTAPVFNVQQNIEQSIHQLPSRASRLKPLASIDVLELEKSESIDKLVAVEVRGGVLESEIQDYWRQWLNKRVESEEIQKFNGWLFAESRLLGYLSYSQTRIRRDKAGDVLEVTITQPKVNAVQMVAAQPELTRNYADLVLKRLQQDFQKGAPVDTLGLDQRLDSASYDLPVELDATVRAVAPELVDLIVNMNPAPDNPGQLLDGVVQLNNYGLKSYGRPQVLASLTWRGHEPRASFNLLGQKSEGLSYARAEYETAQYGAARRWRAWASMSDSRSILGGAAASEGEAAEVGFGFNQIMGGHRDFVFKQGVELTARQSDSGLQSSGINTSRIQDRQLRLRSAYDNEKLATEPSRADLLITAGHYSQLDGITSVREGGYAKVELGFRQQSLWDEARTVSSSIRVRSQWSSRRLDSYNQFALGGIAGVRAYTTVDGVGDSGAQLTAEISKRLLNGMVLTAFYDGGFAKLSNPIGPEYRDRQVLQAVGAQFGGFYQRLSYSLNVAKGVGGYKGWNAYNIESRPDNWRVNFALSYML